MRWLIDTGCHISLGTLVRLEELSALVLPLDALNSKANRANPDVSEAKAKSGHHERGSGPCLVGLAMQCVRHKDCAAQGQVVWRAERVAAGVRGALHQEQ